MRRGGIATCYLTIWHLWPLRFEIRVINGPLPSHVLKAFPVGRLNFQKWNPDAFLDHVWKSDFVRYRFCFPQSHHMLPIAGEWTHTQDPPPLLHPPFVLLPTSQWAQIQNIICTFPNDLGQFCQHHRLVFLHSTMRSQRPCLRGRLFTLDSVLRFLQPKRNRPQICLFKYHKTVAGE